MNEPRTRGERVCAFIETFCHVPEGDLVGEEFHLEPFEREFILAVYDNPHGTRLAILSIAKKNGKGLALGTPIPTPLGWSTIGAIREGDIVFDEHGKPCRVTYESPIHIGLRCWRLTFSDGTSVVADENHRWITTHRPWQAGARFARRRTAMVTTPEIAASWRLGNGEHNHAIALAGALQTDEVALPLDPYLLGCWLGDGDSDCARLTCGDLDLEHFRRAVGDGLSCEPIPKPTGPAWRIRMSNGRGGERAQKFQTGLSRLGLLGNKHVPNTFKWAGTEQRRALLQGLMDTDGTASPTGLSGAVACTYSGCNETLVRDCLFLVRSLGMKATLRSRPAKLRGVQVNTVHEVQFTAYADDAPFRLTRKAARLRPRPPKPSRASSVRIVDCQEVVSVPTKCIVVDSHSHQFLCGEGMTATHNTPLIAAILLAHIVGPEARQNSQIVSGAMSQKQAATVFKYAAKMVDMDDTLRSLVRVRASIKQLIGLPMNVEYAAISRQKKTTQGIAPVVLLLDELGQVRGPQDDFVEGIETAMGAYDDSLRFVISTQAASDSDMLSVWIDDARESKDPHTICHVHCAEDPDCDVLDEDAWRQANPALGIFRSLKDMQELAKKAKRMPTFEASFRNLNLNQRVETKNALIARGVWLANSFPPDPRAFRESPVYGALDLSGRIDLSALVLVAFFEGRWHVRTWFWTPAEGIHERSRQDRQPYPLWLQRGLLRALPGASIDYDLIAGELRDVLIDVKDLRAIAYDRWRMDVMIKSLERTGWHPYDPTDKTQSGDLPLTPFGQGFKDMSPAIDELESELLNDRISHGNHPVLTMCAANAIAVKDEAGNRKLDKKRSTGRIDGIVALAMAMGIAAAMRRNDPMHQLLFV